MAMDRCSPARQRRLQRLALVVLASGQLFRAVASDAQVCSSQVAVGLCPFTGCFARLHGPSHCVDFHCYCNPGYCSTDNKTCIKEPTASSARVQGPEQPKGTPSTPTPMTPAPSTPTPKPGNLKSTHEVDNGCADIHKGTDTYKAAFDKHTFAIGNGNFSMLRDVYHPDAILEVPAELGGRLCGVGAIIAFYEAFFKIWHAPEARATPRRDDTLCPEASLCLSVRSYSLYSDKANFPMASDTFVYSPRGEILFQSFAGRNTLDVPVHPHLARAAPISGCESADDDTEVYEAVLGRHFRAVGNHHVNDVIQDYHPDAVLIFGDQTICGTENIKDKYTELFKLDEYPGGELNLYKKGTTCATGFSCQSYVLYSTSRYSQAVEVLLYNAHGQIVSHTFDGRLAGPEFLASAEGTPIGAQHVDISQLETLAPVALLAAGVAMITKVWKPQRRTATNQLLLQSA